MTQFFFCFRFQLACGTDQLHYFQTGCICIKVGIQSCLICIYIFHFNFFEDALGYGIQDRYLFFYRHRSILALFQNFYDTCTLFQTSLGIRIQI